MSDFKTKCPHCGGIVEGKIIPQKTRYERNSQATTMQNVVALNPGVSKNPLLSFIQMVGFGKHPAIALQQNRPELAIRLQAWRLQGQTIQRLDDRLDNRITIYDLKKLYRACIWLGRPWSRENSNAVGIGQPKHRLIAKEFKRFGLIARVGKSNKYELTQAGRELLTRANEYVS